jgi:hypothetical protein
MFEHIAIGSDQTELWNIDTVTTSNSGIETSEGQSTSGISTNSCTTNHIVINVEESILEGL